MWGDKRSSAADEPAPLPPPQILQHVQSMLAGRHSGAVREPSSLPLPQILQHEQSTPRQQDETPTSLPTMPTPTEKALPEPQQCPELSLPGLRLSYHITPTLETDAGQSPLVSAQHEPPAQVPDRSAVEQHHSAPEQEHTAAQTSAAELPAQPSAHTPISSAQTRQDAEKETQSKQAAEAGNSAEAVKAADAGATAGLSPMSMFKDLPATEVQHGPMQLLSFLCTAPKCAPVTEEQLGLPESSAPMAPAEPSQGANGRQERGTVRSQEAEEEHSNGALQATPDRPAEPQPRGALGAGPELLMPQADICTPDPSPAPDNTQRDSEDAGHTAVETPGPAGVQEGSRPSTPLPAAEHTPQPAVAPSAAAGLEDAPPQQTLEALPAPFQIPAVVSPELSVPVSSTPRTPSCLLSTSAQLT